MPTIAAATSRITGALLALLLAVPAAAQVPCDPIPAMPESAVKSSIDEQVKTMLREQEDFQKPNCEASTPRALRVARLLKPIAAAARDIGASTRFLVLNKNEENAFATGWPDKGYHLIVVYTGMIETLDRRAAQAAARAGRSAAELSDVFLSTVIAHEMSHLILRHAQDTNCRRSSNLNAAGDAAGTPAEGTRVAAPGVVACRQYSQSKELAADSVAAYIMFATRKTSVFSDAGELVRLWELDAAEKRSSGENAFWGERVMSSHPSAVRRAALYMRLWASMLEEQDRYDSAIGLISANVEIDRAIAMLDSVRRALPAAPFLGDAMGAALLTQWLSTVPIGALGVRPTVGVVRTRFVEGLRGDNTGDASLLARARSALEGLPDIDSRPSSLANLALLDAYTGNTARALQRARRAVQLASGDVSILNTLGIAHYQAGQADSARAVFGRILTEGSGQPTETIVARELPQRQDEADEYAYMFQLCACRCTSVTRRSVSRCSPPIATSLASSRGARRPAGSCGRHAQRRIDHRAVIRRGLRRAASTTGAAHQRRRAARSATLGSARFSWSLPTGSVASARECGRVKRVPCCRGSPPRVVREQPVRRCRARMPASSLLVQPDPAGGQKVVGIMSSGAWSLAGVTPGEPISALARLGRVLDRDENTYVFVVTGHLVRVVTDGVVITSIAVRSDQ